MPTFTYPYIQSGSWMLMLRELILKTSERAVLHGISYKIAVRLVMTDWAEELTWHGVVSKLGWIWQTTSIMTMCSACYFSLLVCFPVVMTHGLND